MARTCKRFLGGVWFPVFKGNGNSTRTITGYEVFNNEAGAHVGIAKNFREARDLDIKTNFSVHMPHGGPRGPHHSPGPFGSPPGFQW